MRDTAWMTRSVQRALLWITPDGGQRVARRNAWGSLVDDTRRRAQRIEVQRSVDAALAARHREDVAAV